MGNQAVVLICRFLAVTLGVSTPQVNIAFRYFARCTLAAIALVAVTACGGGGDTPPPPPPPATHLLLTVPAAAFAHVSVPIIVTALDASNNTATSYNASVLITSSDGQALLPAVAVVLADGRGVFNVTLQSVGAQTLTATDTVRVSIAGTSPPIDVSAAAPITITSGPPPGGVVGFPYSPRHICSGGRCGPVYNFPLTASGGVGNITWTWAAVAGSSLPPGLSLTNNLIGGTPAVGSAGSYNVIVTATDGDTPAAVASLPYKITVVNPPPPVITTLPGPPGATLNQPYSYQFEVNGFAPVTVSEIGALPPGLAPLTATGLLAGTPTTANIYPITVHAIDANGQDTPQAFTIGVFQHGFAPTGGMHFVRYLHTATLLSNGQVLVAGGPSVNGGSTGTISSELYNPTSGNFVTTGALHVARFSHTATLLCDLAALPCTNPMVLVVGGWTQSGITGSAELYDPTAGTFTLAVGSLATSRGGHTATLLRSGKVLIAGGTADGTTGLATAELFDPATGTFQATAAPMTSARVYHTATLLADGRVLIAGGVAGGLASQTADGIITLATAELFDPATGTFSAIASPMTMPRYEHTATLLPGGKVLIAGGYALSLASVGATELYDPAAVAPAASFTATGALVTPRANHTAVLLPSGQVLLAGGDYNVVEALQHAELYDPASGLCTSTGEMQTARIWPTLTSLGSSGKVLVVGGENNDHVGGLNTAEIYQ